jgi:hypothetical protein
MVQRQATMLSFLDMMRIFGGLFVLIVPLVWFTRSPRTRRGSVAAH